MNWKRYILVFAAFVLGMYVALLTTGRIGTQQPVTPINHPDAAEGNGSMMTPADCNSQEIGGNRRYENTADSESNVESFRDQSASAAATQGYVSTQSGRANAFQQFNDPYDERRGVPDWQNDTRFKDDVFTFVRVKYDDWGGGGPGDFGGGRYGRFRGGWGRWRTDFPDSDLNFSFRLQQLTSLKVNPDPIYLELTDERLFDYPFLYMIEPGGLHFSDEEVKSLRRYLDNGGFMMVDDFWGEMEYENFYREIKRVYPKREPLELAVDHPIFHCVYDLKEKPQVPSLHAWERSGLSYERFDAVDVDYRAFFDDKGRMTVIICHNTDLGDGWEREGENKEYFRLFSERLAYPMGINIVVYAMTH